MKIKSKYKYEVWATDRYNLTHIIQPGAGYQNPKKCLREGFLSLGKSLKPMDIHARVVVKDIERNAIVINTGVIPLYDQTII